MKRLLAVLLLCAGLLLCACGADGSNTGSDIEVSPFLPGDKATSLHDSYLEQFGRKYMQQDSLLERWMDASLRRILRTALENARETLRYMPYWKKF